MPTPGDGSGALRPLVDDEVRDMVVAAPVLVDALEHMSPW